jgi:hypothetical protein
MEIPSLVDHFVSKLEFTNWVDLIESTGFYKLHVDANQQKWRGPLIDEQAICSTTAQLQVQRQSN